MGTKSDCLNLNVNMKKQIYLHFNSTTQSCPNYIFKTFPIEDFLHLPPVPATQLMYIERRISPRIFEKIRNNPNGIRYSGPRGKLIHEKTWSRKSRGIVLLGLCHMYKEEVIWCWGGVGRHYREPGSPGLVPYHSVPVHPHLSHRRLMESGRVLPYQVSSAAFFLFTNSSLNL